MLGANGSGKSTLVRGLLGPDPAAHRRGRAVRHPARAASPTTAGSASSPSALTATTGVPASVREVVSAGRSGPPPRLAADARRRPARRAGGARGRRPGRPRQGRHRPSSPAASSSGSSSPARWPASPTCSSSTSRPPGSTSPARRASPASSSGSSPAAPRSCSSPTRWVRWRRSITRTVVMRDGRIAYDGAAARHLPRRAARPRAPPADHRAHADYSPDVRTPLDGPRGRPRSAERAHGREEPPMSILALEFMQRALLAAVRHRAGRARRRHLPRAAPPGPHGRRHRPRRRHRRRHRAAHPDLPRPHRRRGRDPRLGGGRDRARPRDERRRRPGADVLRRHRRRRAADRARRAGRDHAEPLPLRVDRHRRRRRPVGRRRAGRGRGRRSASGSRRGCSRSPRTPTSPGSRGSTCGPTTCWSRCWPRSPSPSRCAPSGCCWSARSWWCRWRRCSR